MHTKLMIERYLIVFLCVLLWGCDVASSAEPGEEEYALELLERYDLRDDSAEIERVLRDELETVVWTTGRFAGLPVFYQSVGYVFDADGVLAVRPGTSEPMLLGEPMAPESAFPLDTQADITAEEAASAYIARIKQEDGPGSYYDGHTPVAVLGFHNIRLGSSSAPEYQLAWRVAPEDGKWPLAMIDAKKGDVLLFDSGVRTSRPRPPSPMPPVADGGVAEDPPWPAYVGQWWSPRCGSREYERIVELFADQSFTVTDLVAPCPEGARCIWSGIIVRKGTWRERGGNLIALAELAAVREDTRPAGPQGEPIPGALTWDAGAEVLREAMPGESTACEYRRHIRAGTLPSATPSSPDPLPDLAADSTCRDAVQGRIAWNPQGARRWQENNIARLCGDAESTEPATCFDQILNGDSVPRSEPWHWQDAIALCSAVGDAASTVQCARVKSAAGTDRADIIAECRRESTSLAPD